MSTMIPDWQNKLNEKPITLNKVTSVKRNFLSFEFAGGYEFMEQDNIVACWRSITKKDDNQYYSVNILQEQTNDYILKYHCTEDSKCLKILEEIQRKASLTKLPWKNAAGRPENLSGLRIDDKEIFIYFRNKYGFESTISYPIDSSTQTKLFIKDFFKSFNIEADIDLNTLYKTETISNDRIIDLGD